MEEKDGSTSGSDLQDLEKQFDRTPSDTDVEDLEDLQTSNSGGVTSDSESGGITGPSDFDSNGSFDTSLQSNEIEWVCIVEICKLSLKLIECYYNECIHIREYIYSHLSIDKIVVLMGNIGTKLNYNVTVNII